MKRAFVTLAVLSAIAVPSVSGAFWNTECVNGDLTLRCPLVWSPVAGCGTGIGDRIFAVQRFEDLLLSDPARSIPLLATCLTVETRERDPHWGITDPTRGVLRTRCAFRATLLLLAMGQEGRATVERHLTGIRREIAALTTAARGHDWRAERPGAPASHGSPPASAERVARLQALESAILAALRVAQAPQRRSARS